MIEKGILPDATELTPMNPMPDGTHSPGDDVRPWASLSAEEKALFSRMAEVYAGFSEYTDAGRPDHRLPRGDRPARQHLIFYCADNGASGEGPRTARSTRTSSSTAGRDVGEPPAPRRPRQPDTYNHYPTGWAFAFSTPFRMFKRYSYQGGVYDPMVIHWPKGIKAKGEVRRKYHHSIDVPTILECIGMEFPKTLNGHEQVPLLSDSDEVLLRRRGRADTQGTPGTRDARHPWHLGEGLEGRHRPRTDVGYR